MDLGADIRVFRSTLRQSRPNKAGLVCPSVHMYVHTSIHPSTKSFFDFKFSMTFGMCLEVDE